MAAFIGEIRMFAGNFAPTNWALCQGQMLSIAQFGFLFELLGSTFGGDGVTTFALPDLQGRFPLHAGNGTGLTPRVLGDKGGEERVALTIRQCPAHSHSAVAGPKGDQPIPAGHFWSTDPNGNTAAYNSAANAQMAAGAIGTAGAGYPHDNMHPFLAISYIISLEGVFPGADPTGGDDPTSDAFIGEIRCFGSLLAPANWAPSDGALTAITKNAALFSILGTNYGGDGRSNFALPDLRGRSPLGWGAGAGVTVRNVGDVGGEEQFVLNLGQLPSHSHIANCNSGAGNSYTPGNQYWAQEAGGANEYDVADAVQMAPSALGAVGGGQSHVNLQPYLALNFCICLAGIYPPRT